MKSGCNVCRSKAEEHVTDQPRKWRLHISPGMLEVQGTLFSTDRSGAKTGRGSMEKVCNGVGGCVDGRDT